MNKIEELRNEIYEIMDKAKGIFNIKNILDVEALVSRMFEEDPEVKAKYKGSIKKYCEEELNF